MLFNISNTKNFQKKSGTDVASDGHTKWPETELEIWQGGISAVWNFSSPITHLPKVQ